MVLYQLASSDMIQSTLAIENVTAKTIRNAADRRTLTRVHRRSPSASCRCDPRRIAAANRIHAAQQAPERARKKGHDSHQRLNAQPGPPSAMNPGSVHP